MKIFPAAQVLAHDRRDLLWVGALDQLTDRKREVARALMGRRRVQRHVQLHALATRRLRAHLERQVVEQVADEQSDLRALDDRRGRARIEIEDDRARGLDVLCPRHRGVQLERRHVACPHERGALVELAVLDRAFAVARTTCGRHPWRSVLRTPLLEERRCVDAVREPLEGERALARCAGASPGRCARSSR